jgi:hypothetical protein
MSIRLRAMLVMHGGVILLLGLLSGFLAVADSVGSGTRGWQSVHQTLLAFGVWMVATGSGAALLRLPDREARALVWSLVGAGYSLLVVLVVRATTGVQGFEIGGSAADWIALVANGLVSLGSVLAAMLTIDGALRAMRAGDPPAPSRGAV